jgi:hypothetical protein
MARVEGRLLGAQRGLEGEQVRVLKKISGGDLGRRAR